MNEKLVPPRAEEVLPSLREGHALLPGCRDRQSRPLIFIPSKEHSINADTFRKLLKYLQDSIALESRDQGITIVIDMRGKQASSSNLKTFLKAIDDLCSSSATVHSVLIMKPEKFWDNKKAQLTTGSTRCEIQWIAADQLIRYVDVTQVPREIGGSYPYNHEEWLKTRIELERWIWKVSDILQGLEKLRLLIKESERSPADVVTAKRLIDTHNAIRERILSLCSIEVLLDEHNNIAKMINNPQSGVHNPDLKATLPHMKRLIDSCVTVKEEVFHIWKEKHDELEGAYQFRLYEQDAEEKLRWVMHHSSLLAQSIGDIGRTEAEATEKQRQFDDIEKAVRNSDVTVEQLTNRSSRLRAVGTPHRSQVDRSDQLLREEWERLKLMLIKRRTIVTAAVAFFRCLGKYNTRYRSWLDHPGVDASRIDSKNDTQLDAAIRQHQEFWSQVEAIYVDAVQKASELKQQLKAANASDAHGHVVLMAQDLGKAQKQLHDVWRENKVKLHSMLALTAFHSDTQRVLEWLNEHGDPYLVKNTKIGDSQEQAKQLQRNHDQFRKIAENTNLNAEKLFEASKMIAESGVADSVEMRRLLGDLEARLSNFRHRCDIRNSILNRSQLFHTHFNEITTWYTGMEAKYNQRICSDDLNDCEQAKEMWVQENDATAGAYATTMGEGTELINELRANQETFQHDYTPTIARILELIKKLEEANARFVSRWSLQRQILDIACSYAGYVRDVTEVIHQIASWEEDMRTMVTSATFLDHAVRVKPYHEENFHKVKDAVAQIRAVSKELLQAIHGNQLTDMTTRDGTTLVAAVQENSRVLDRAERQVTALAQQTSDKIDYALKYIQLRQLAADIIRTYENLEGHMVETGTIPDSQPEAVLATEKHKQLRANLEKASLSSNELARRFFAISAELVESNMIPRIYPTQLNESVTNQWRQLCAVTEERHKLLNTAVAYYKTMDNVGPILDQVERRCAAPWQHVCQGTELDLQAKTERIAHELSMHEEWKEKFVKAFPYAQKTSDSFIKYIQRWNTICASREIEERVAEVNRGKVALRQRQTRIFEMWTEKKRRLESCHRFILVEASRREESDWLEGEGAAQLSRFQGHVKQLAAGGGGGAGADKETILEDFCRFKITVKERRAKIQTLLNVAKDMLNIVMEHRGEMEKGMAQIRDRFEKFSRTVADCETALRGGKTSAASKDELSLDRNSDNSVGERMEAVGTVVSKEMKKMREPVEELIKTEREYVKDLQKCVETYIREFDSAAATLPLPLRGRRAEIFSNIEEIFDFHSKIFLAELLKYENDPEAVGCSFTFHVDCLSRLYTKYCANMATSNEIRDLPEAVQYFGALGEKYQGESLSSMLIKPVQRITRYGLMIEKLLRMTEALVKAEGQTTTPCHRNVEEIRDAYEVVLSVPKRANDIIHLNHLDKDKLGMTGEFVWQDQLTVWEPKTLFNKGKERQVFLFELAVVVAKKYVMPSKTERYLPKGKPILLNSITVVEHVESDVCRFGLRIGNESSNDNRIDFKARDEKEKIAWVRKIREYHAGLSVNVESSSWEARSLAGSSNGGGARASKISSSSGGGDRLSRDAESLSSNEQRHSIQSYDSNEGLDEEETNGEAAVVEEQEEGGGRRAGGGRVAGAPEDGTTIRDL